MAKKKTHQSANYFQIVEYNQKNGKERADIGKFLSEPSSDSIAVDNEGKIRNYELFDSIEGTIQDVFIFDKEMESGKRFEVLAIKVLNPENETEILQVGFKSAFSSDLIRRLPNVSPEAPIELKAFKIEREDGRGYNKNLVPYQLHGEKMESCKLYFTKDSPNGMPEAKLKEKPKNKKNAPDEWDFTEVNDFLYKIVNDFREALKLERQEISPNTSPAETNDDLPY